MLLRVLTLIFLAIIKPIFGQDCVLTIGEIKPEEWIDTSYKHIQGGKDCLDSYFKIDIVQESTSDIFQILSKKPITY